MVVSAADRAPNLFLVGVPKGGTTTLAAWLVDHPDVAGGDEKELRFLMDPDSTMLGRLSYHADGADAYGRLFPEAAARARYRLDASPQYYYQETARKVIPRLVGDGHVIFVFREPARRIHSLFRYAQNNQAVLPQDMAFRTFLGLVRGQDARLRAERPMLASAIEHSRYARWVELWQQAIPAERLHFVLFEQLVAEPQAGMHALSRELGLDPAPYAEYDFPIENPTYRVRSPLVHKLMRAVRGLAIPAGLKAFARGFYYRTNVASDRGGPSEDDRACLAELSAEFEADNRELAELTGLDLSIWRR